MKDNSSVFLYLKPCILWTKRTHRKEIFRLLSDWVKIHQIPHLKPQVSFSLTFASLFSVMRDNSSVLFQLKLYLIWTKGTHQSAKFHTLDCSHEISPNLYFARLLWLKVYQTSAKKV